SGKPVMQFLGVGASKRVAYLNEVLAKATNGVGGTYINNPFFAALGEQEVRSVFALTLLSCLTQRGTDHCPSNRRSEHERRWHRRPRRNDRAWRTFDGVRERISSRARLRGCKRHSYPIGGYSFGD